MSSKKSLKHTDKSIYKQLFSLVLPIAFQYLMYSSVSATDAIMLGFLDQNSLSASSLAGQVAFVLSLFSGSLVAGLTVIAAQYWGKRDTETVERIFAMVMRYSLIIGGLFTLAAMAVPNLLMRIFTSDPLIIAAGVSYLRVIGLSYILGAFAQVYFCIMKICDRAALSSIISSISVVINIVLNGFLIFGWGPFPRLGIIGAALASVISIIFEIVFCFVDMRRGNGINLRLSYLFRPADKTLIKDFWNYSAPLFINQMGWGLGVTMYSVIMGHLGSDATAANSIANIVRNMAASLCWGIAEGVAIILGNMLGNNELDEAKRMGGKFVRLAVLIGAASGGLILLVSPLVMRVVTLTPTAMYYLKWMLVLASYYIIGNALNSTIISGIFPSGGDTRFGMICDLITLWACVVPLGLIAAFVLKLPVLAVAFILTLDEFVKIPAVYLHYKKYKWVKNITH